MLHNTKQCRDISKYSESSACDQNMASQAQSTNSSFPLFINVSSKTKLAGGFHHKNILAQLCVDREDLRVAHKGERQDWNGVGRL